MATTIILSRVSGVSRHGSAGLPLLICLPGGSYNHRYFDVPDRSLLEAAAERGLPIVVLDRPGYGDSEPLVGEISFRRNAEVLDDAIGELWMRHGDGCPGIVLVGHSMGGAVAVHIAARQRTWPLLGISITAIHDKPAIPRAWNDVPAGTSIEFSTQHRVRLMYGPPETYDPAVIEAAQPACSPIPVAELREVVDG